VRRTGPASAASPRKLADAMIAGAAQLERENETAADRKTRCR
jgi:hypothetical protein